MNGGKTQDISNDPYGKKIRRLCRGAIIKKLLDMPKNAGYVVNNFDAKYVDILFGNLLYEWCSTSSRFSFHKSVSDPTPHDYREGCS